MGRDFAGEIARSHARFSLSWAYEDEAAEDDFVGAFNKQINQKR